MYMSNATDEPTSGLPLFDIDNLPEDFEAPGGAAWATFQKRVPTKAIRIDGPFEVVTSHGGDPVHCEDGWLAIDAAGYPYPITDGEFREAYQPEMPPRESSSEALLLKVENAAGSVVGTVCLDEGIENPWDFALTPMVETGFDTEEGVDTVLVKGMMATPRSTLDMRERETEPPYAFVGPDFRSDLLFAELAAYIEKQGGSIGLRFDLGRDEWSLMANFGEETPGSEMAAGSALGSGTLRKALENAARECGLIK